MQLILRSVYYLHRWYVHDRMPGTSKATYVEFHLQIVAYTYTQMNKLVLL